MQNTEARLPVKHLVATVFRIGYDTVIVLVACGIFGASLIILYDIVTDFRYLGSPNHTFAHLISDLMLALIIMALLDQVINAIRNHPFSLLPFIAIALIASVRGFLVAQIKVGLGEIEWGVGLIQLGSYAAITIAMATCFYFFSRKAKENSHSEQAHG